MSGGPAACLGGRDYPGNGQDTKLGDTLPFAVSGDGKDFFTADYTPSWTGVLAIHAGTAERTRIEAFASPIDQVMGGDFDGGWSVWSEGHSFTSLDDWTLQP